MTASDREDLQLSAQQYEYLSWLVMPAAARAEAGLPSSEAKWAQTNGLDITTPRRWKRQEHFRKEWKAQAMALQGTPERTQEMLDSLYDQGRGSKDKCEHCGQRGGDVRAAELWGRWTGQLKAAEQPAQPVSVRDVSDEELQKILVAAAQDELALRRKSVQAG